MARLFLSLVGRNTIELFKIKDKQKDIINMIIKIKLLGAMPTDADAKRNPFQELLAVIQTVPYVDTDIDTDIDTDTDTDIDTDIATDIDIDLDVVIVRSIRRWCSPVLCRGTPGTHGAWQFLNSATATMQL